MSAVLQLPILREIKKAVGEGKIGTPAAQAAAQQSMKTPATPATSTREQRAAAASRRSRRAGRRSLLAGGRLGAGGDGGNQTTLGAG